MTYFGKVFDFVMRWVSVVLLCITILIFVIILGLGIFATTWESDPDPLTGWKYKCKKVDNPTLKIGGHVLQFSQLNFYKISFSQTASQKAATPDNVFCKDANISFVEANRIAIQEPRKVYYDSGKSLPIGLRQIVIRQGSVETLKENCIGDIKIYEYCSVYKNIMNTNLTVRYKLTTTPNNSHGKLITPEQYPYAYYPREDWDATFKEVETYILSLMAE